MPRYRFVYELEAEDVEMAYDIAQDIFGCFDVEEVEDEL